MRLRRLSQSIAANNQGGRDAIRFRGGLPRPGGPLRDRLSRRLDGDRDLSLALTVVVGSMSLLWMAGLAVVFLLEKTARPGLAFGRVVGLAAIAGAVGVLATGWSP